MYNEDNLRQDRKENKNRLTQKARKSFRKDIRTKRDESLRMRRREQRLQSIENENEFLNTGTDDNER